MTDRQTEIRIEIPDPDAQFSVDVVRKVTASSIKIEEAMSVARIAAPTGLSNAHAQALSMTHALPAIMILASEGEVITPPDGIKILPPGTVEVLPGTPSVPSWDGPSGDRGSHDAATVSPNFVPTDPLYANQWHFQLMTNGGTLAATIETIWNEFDGSGINVGVYDSGVQSIHGDLNNNYNAALHVVVGGNTLPGDPIANPPPNDFHGTAVAGIIGSEANGSGGVGVAWDSNLTGVNIFDPSSPAFINAANRAGFFEAVHQMANFDVINNSWGSTPFYDFSQSLANPSSFDSKVVAEYEFAIDTGRGGLGTNIVQSAGNNNLDSNGTGIGATRFTITVNALLENGFASSYSSFGANSLVSAPGGDTGTPPGVNGTRRVTTTDLLGTDGVNTFADPTGPQDFTDKMNGTSAAAPMVSGVIALMLDANPDLGWRDVQNILGTTAFLTGSGLGATSLGLNENHFWYVNGANNVNGGGAHFNESYGYGNVDPFGAVRLAESYAIIGKPAKTSANEVSAATAVLPVNLTTADAQPGTPSIFSFKFAQNVSIEHIAFDINYLSTDIQDLRIILTSAEGTQVVMQTEQFANTTSLSNQSWVAGVDALRGELSAGNWTLSFTDNFAGDLTTINSVQMTVYGSTPTVDDVYTYTDEYFALEDLNSTRGTLADTNGGVDWINMAALSTLAGSTLLNLNAGTASTVSNAPFTIAAGTVIEHAITGDGNDTVTGNSANNKLYGMRGIDTLNGGIGNDTLDGGAGGDTLNGGSEDDTITGGAGADKQNGGSGLDIFLIGSAADFTGDTITGASGIDRIRFTSTKAGETLTLTNAVTQVEIAEIANAAGSFAGTIALNLNAAAVLTGMTLTGNNGANTITGTGQADTLNGGVGNDFLNGGSENDTLNGGSENDVLNGGSGDDTLNAGSGNDELTGASGKDTLIGASGLDSFVFNSTLGATNIDTISGFNHNDDVILLDDDVFTQAGPVGALTAGFFWGGTSAHDAMTGLSTTP